MSKTIIFKNNTEIKWNLKKINDYINILNYNYNKVKQYNQYLNYKVAYYLTFYTLYGNNRIESYKQIESEITNLLDKENPFNSPEMVEKFTTELITKFHQNYYYNHNNDKIYYSANEGGNLPIIRYKEMSFCNRFILFDTKEKKFVRNENNTSQMIEELTYYCENKKQEKITKLLTEIDERVQELNKIPFDDYLIYGGNGVNFEQLFTYIQKVK